MERRTYLNNLLVEESLEHLPAALEHPDTASFKAYLREHLHQNSVKTRLKYAEYIAYRYSKDGRMNLALARFLKLCPDPRTRREALWFETVRGTPLLRELTESWLAKLPESGGSREELLEFLAARIGDRKPDKIATEAIGAIQKFGHLRKLKQKRYQAVWLEPPTEALVYVLSQLHPSPTVVRMETFKANPLWQALLWPPTGLERLILQAESSGILANVTKLDNYYQFVLGESGETRMQRLFQKWESVITR
jgi:hypothetical protein